jgi:hypothetical protein
VKIIAAEPITLFYVGRKKLREAHQSRKEWYPNMEENGRRYGERKILETVKTATAPCLDAWV